MAKKKKQQAESASQTLAAASSSSSSSASADAEAARLQRAFDLGNFSMVRTLAASSTSSEAKAVAATLMSRVNIEREQLYVGFAGLVVVLIAAGLVLTTG